MWLKRGIHAAALVLLGASLVSAQEPLDITRLPVNLEKLERALQQSAVRDETEGLNVRYMVEVYGRAPRLELFDPNERWATGPAPYGGPTHRDMLDQMTPQEFRAPAADVGALVRWLVEKANRK